MIDISKAFTTSGEPVETLFQRPGVGFYIPLYQREYSWDKENIDQLMEDVCRGVDTSITDSNEIRFMGTIILVKENNPAQNIRPQDNRALPPRIDNVIDGQQRISSIALLACLIYQRLQKLKKKFKSDSLYDALKEDIDAKLSTLIEIFSVDIKRGSPTRKPLIIRGSIDQWTYDGTDDPNYKSDISLYLSRVIRSIIEKTDFPPIPNRTTRVGQNLNIMDRLLNQVEKCHLSSTDVFPPAWEILKGIPEELIWTYNRPELLAIVNSTTLKSSDNPRKLICSLVQLFAFTHYLLNRCCFTLIEPVSDNWAFDMFQSLNATGTPLTAVETFKPLVVNRLTTDKETFKGSPSDMQFRKVDELLGSASTAAQKSKLTNEYLTAFALTYDGTKLSSQFSMQRRWLIKEFTQCEDPDACKFFVQLLSEMAVYWCDVLRFDPSQSSTIDRLEHLSDQDKKVSAVCALYLDAAGHKMANTILSRFYSNLIRSKPNADKEFAQAIKAIAAFFSLWRAATSNTGLDDVYRKLLRGDKDWGTPSFSWKSSDSGATVGALKSHLRLELQRRDIGAKTDWLNRAKTYLRYDNQASVCKFALLLYAHDTIPDPDCPELAKIGKENVEPLMDSVIWKSEEMKNLEHIAPQHPPDGHDWDGKLYENDDFQRIGNLTLLPAEINSLAANKSWPHKLMYYRHLSEKDPAKLKTLEDDAKAKGIELTGKAIELLTRAKHNKMVATITNVATWDLDLVESRSERICSICWDRLYPWLED